MKKAWVGTPGLWPGGSSDFKPVQCSGLYAVLFADSSTNMKKIKKILIGFFILLIMLGLYSWLIEPRLVGIKKITISSPDIPLGFDGCRIVFVSDIHHGPWFGIGRLRSVVEKINSLKPDLVLLGGDYSHRSDSYIGPAFETLAGIKAPLGVYGVMGNHDHWESKILTLQGMHKAGIGSCDNRSYLVYRGGHRIIIGGVGDLWTDCQRVDSTVRYARDEDFCILLSHNPDFMETLEDSRIDLVLSGHTHAGQISFFGLASPVLPSEYGQKYRYGLHLKNRTLYYITSGVGTITPPIRFSAPPEIVLLTLKKTAY